MNNDLISRSELLGKFMAMLTFSNDRVVLIENVIEQIQNAPTVERPQGEWIDYSNEGYVECPFCHEATNCDDNKEELHYCWNCGAQMKGGAE